MEASAKLTGMTELKQRYRDYLDKLTNDERLVAESLVEAAEPFADRIREGLAAHHVTGRTAADVQTRIRRAEPGIATVAVGATSDSNGRAYILRDLEQGTSKQAATPIVRPAWDVERGGLMRRFAAALRARLGGGR